MLEEQILFNDDLSILLSEEGEDKDICIGVPHHAPLGISILPCSTHNESDENTGLIGFKVAQELHCSYVVACNYFIDSNKCLCSDYSKRINNFKPKLVIEIHGHGGKNAKYDIEISCGSKEKNDKSKLFAEILSSHYAKHSICGDFEQIKLKASNTATINTKQWLGIHIEILKEIRKNCDHEFINALVKTIIEFKNKI